MPIPQPPGRGSTEMMLVAAKASADVVTEEELNVCQCMNINGDHTCSHRCGAAS
ncbi:hypothetical protein ACIHAR_02275 [Streptomyces sp. NPDC052016]|uniref:hypothetical protein n=1 Tax=Streptomyces sp. NPDC052016 TaxID=3365680 RepID=UPI0037CF9D8D